MAELETLKRLIKTREPVLWVGAGLSIEAGLPTVGRLADLLWDKFAFTPKPTDKEPYALIDFFHKKYGKGDLNQALSKIIPAGVKTRPSHHALARMAKANSFSGVITTNYDQLVDNAFAEHEVDYLPQILDSNQQIREDKRLRLYKIHGDVSDWQKVILTGESYSTFRNGLRSALPRLQAAQRTWCGQRRSLFHRHHPAKGRMPGRCGLFWSCGGSIVHPRGSRLLWWPDQGKTDHRIRQKRPPHYDRSTGGKRSLLSLPLGVGPTGALPTGQRLAPLIFK
jgi:NAD-dependent SIR2 family protein deacetylase